MESSKANHPTRRTDGETVCRIGNIYVLVWMVNKRMEQLGLSENTVRHYTEEGLAVILKKHYDSGTESYSDKLISQLTEERRLQYEQGEVGRTTYQNLRKAAAMLQEFRLTGKSRWKGFLIGDGAKLFLSTKRFWINSVRMSQRRATGLKVPLAQLQVWLVYFA